MLAGILPTTSGAAAPSYDIVLRGGLDPESGLSAQRDVAISGGRIAAVSAAHLPGREIIDVAGQVVAAGFIDLHSHAHNTLLGGRVQAYDGVTTAIGGEGGQLPIEAALCPRPGRPIRAT